MKIAIVGSGIAGLTCAYLLQRHHDISLFEAQGWIGGHAHTLDLALEGARYAVDTGFTVFNAHTYPNFVRLLAQLGVAYRQTDLSFSFSDPGSGTEYNSRNLETLFAQRRNLFSADFWGMVRDIQRFHREVNDDLDQHRISDTLTLGDYLRLGHYGPRFAEHYLLPLGSAIWCLSRSELLDFPLHFFLSFLRHQGLLTNRWAPHWYTVEGGSSRYVEALTRGFRERIRLHCPVGQVVRDATGVTVHSVLGSERFDKVVFACHSDQALRLLARPTPAERSILGALPYVSSDVALHTDTRLLPDTRRARAGWNYRLSGPPERPVALTYDMSRLQGIDAPETFCLTLNQTAALDPQRILARFVHAHPQYNQAGIEAQARWRELCGAQHSYYCGAYWGHGLHEDGVVSALRVGEAFGEYL